MFAPKMFDIWSINNNVSTKTLYAKYGVELTNHTVKKKGNMISAMLSWWKGKNEKAVSIIMSVIRGGTTRIRNWDVYSVKST